MDRLEKNKNPILAIITEHKMRTICGRLCAKIADGNWDGGDWWSNSNPAILFEAS